MLMHFYTIYMRICSYFGVRSNILGVKGWHKVLRTSQLAFTIIGLMQQVPISQYLHSPTISLDGPILDRRSSYTHERHSFTRSYV